MPNPASLFHNDDDPDNAMAVPRYHKLSFPTFDGKEDPLGWLNRCEHFFRAQHTRECDKVWLASFHLISVAQHWFYMLERDAGDIAAINWPMFRSLCHQRFGPPLGTNHLAELARLPFRDSVADYQEAFQARMAHAGYLAPAQQVQLFTGGLPDPLRTDVELQAPPDLQRAMALARAYERRATTAPAPQGRPPRSSPTTPLVSATTSAAATSPASSTAALAVPPRQLRRLTPTEMAERQRQGLCYNCDEPYIHGHKCQRLFFLEVSDFEEPDQQVHTGDATSDERPPLISLHAVTGIGSADCMQVKVGIGNHQFTALLDSGSTHNFISSAAARHVGLTCTANRGVNVIVANGEHVACTGLAQDVAIRIGDEFFSVDCYTFPLDCYDMVLGVSFLRTLGPILWDFDDLCMAFGHHGKRVLWKGIGSSGWDIPSTSRLRLHTIQKEDQPLLDDLHLLLSDPTANGVAMDAEQVSAVSKWPQPVSARTLRAPSFQLFADLQQELQSDNQLNLPEGLIKCGSRVYIPATSSTLQIVLQFAPPASATKPSTPPLPPLQHGRLLQAPERVLRSQLQYGVWYVPIN